MRTLSAAGVATTFDAFGRATEQNRSSSYTQVVYAPSGQKFAFVNGQTLVKYIDPMVAGMAAVHLNTGGNGTGYFQHSDWLGSSRLAHDGSGNVIYDRAYAPFGEPYNESATTNRDFTGQTQDTDPGLYDFLFRQQSHSQGRWLTPDPAGVAAVDITNPQTWNRYAYVANNPLNATDPLGLYNCQDFPDDPGCNGGGGWFGGGGGGGGGGIGNCDPFYTLCTSNGQPYPGWNGGSVASGNGGLGCGDPRYASVHPLGCNPNFGSPVFPGAGGTPGGETLGIPGGISTGSWGIPVPFPTNLSCPTGASFLCGGIDPSMNEQPSISAPPPPSQDYGDYFACVVAGWKHSELATFLGVNLTAYTASAPLKRTGTRMISGGRFSPGVQAIADTAFYVFAAATTYYAIKSGFDIRSSCTATVYGR